jgi:hypothetical protein
MLATGRGELEASIVDLTVEEREIVTHRDMMTSVTKELKTLDKLNAKKNLVITKKLQKINKNWENLLRNFK